MNTLKATRRLKLKVTRRRESICDEDRYAVNATMVECGYALVHRRLAERTMRSSAIQRGSWENCNIQNRGCALLKPSTEGMH